jgi:hypothetical protein
MLEALIRVLERGMADRSLVLTLAQRIVALKQSA